jgi:4-amino-4-deoxy-L-arabinose transferase-like glycosyltransferase
LSLRIDLKIVAFLQRISILEVSGRVKRPENIKHLKYVALAVLAFAGLCLFFSHLAAQSRSQGYVLEELEPVMAFATGVGEWLFWLCGKPLFAPMAIAMPLALASISFSLADRKNQKRFVPNVLLLAVAAGFFIMYACGVADNLPAYLFGIAFALALGYLNRWHRPAEEDKNPKAGKAEIVLLTVIVLFGLIIRLYHLDVFPRVFTADEQYFANAGLHLFGNNSDFFSEAAWAKTHLIKLLYLRVGFSALGVGMFQARVTSVLEGVLCIVLIYFLCRKMWGNVAGIFAAFLLSVDPWHHGFSRMGNHFIESPLFLLLLFLLLIQVVTLGGKFRYACLGIAIGVIVYLYQACYIMAPFAVAAVAVKIYYNREIPRAEAIKEPLWMIPGTILAVLPVLLFARENLGALLSEQTVTKGFFIAAEHFNQSPFMKALTVFKHTVLNLIELWPKAEHPFNGFYLNAVIAGLGLMGLGMLVRSRKNFENWMILLWIPIAFVPVIFGYIYVDRRIFATFAPIPAMLAALPLAGLWIGEAATKPFQKAISRSLVVLLALTITFTSLFIVYEDCDPTRGGTPHPRKAPEFISRIPSGYKILISSRIQKYPFLLYMASYDAPGKEMNGNDRYGFVSFEELEPMAEKIAGESRVAVITNHQPRELKFLQSIKQMNPRAEITISEQFLACIIHGY